MRAHLFLFAALLCLSACPAALHGVGTGTGSNIPAMTPLPDHPQGRDRRGDAAVVSAS